MKPVFSAQLVPWYNSEEWNKVFTLIFGGDSNDTCKREALQILLVWKARCPILPSGIESTLGLLEVDLQQPVNDMSSTVPDRLLRLMYSSVLMRFINHMLDADAGKGETLLKAAVKRNIPEWIVNLRHETAHGHELPSLNLLKSAAHFAMNWLFDTYWKPQHNVITDYTTVSPFKKESLDTLTNLIQHHNFLAIFCYHKLRVQTISAISDKHVRKSLIDFLSQHLYKSKVEKIDKTPIPVILNKVVKEIDNYLGNINNSDADYHMARIMLDEESLFMATDIDFAKIGLSTRNYKIPHGYTSVWEPILTVLHKRNMISALVNQLLELVEGEHEKLDIKGRAAYWIKEIAIGLHKSKVFQSIPNRQLFVAQNVKKEELFQHLIHHHPNQKDGLTFHLMHPVPDCLSNSQFIFERMKNLNSFIKVYIKEILALSSDEIPQSSINDLMRSIDIMNRLKGNDEINDEEIYTVADITGQDHNEAHKMDTDVYNESIKSGDWERAAVDFDWASSPIGVLPWQLATKLNPSFAET